jgi:SAM-dependent methyltransferase
MSVASRWLERWDDQQERYIPDREERFQVIADVVQATVGLSPRVLDLGCGPGSLSARLLAQIPGAQIVGIDGDPVLLEIARETAAPEIVFVDADLRDPGWIGVGCAGAYDAVVSTTALHWLTAETLARVYTQAAQLLRPGGVLVNGDHFHTEQGPTTGELALDLDRLRAERHGGGGEDWGEWWRGVLLEPELQPAVRERERREFRDPDHRSEKRLDVHLAALREAGFSDIDIVWRKGTDAVLVAAKPI